LLKKGRDAGGKACKKAIDEHDDTSRANDANQQLCRCHQQKRPHNAKDDGNNKQGFACFASFHKFCLILPFIVNEVVDFHVADSFPASEQCKEIDCGKVSQSQPDGFQRKVVMKVIRYAEHGQKDGSECLINQITQRKAEQQRDTSYRQIFQEEQTCHLVVFQPNEQVGS